MLFALLIVILILIIIIISIIIFPENATLPVFRADLPLCRKSVIINVTIMGKVDAGQLINKINSRLKFLQRKKKLYPVLQMLTRLIQPILDYSCFQKQKRKTHCKIYMFLPTTGPNDTIIIQIIWMFKWVRDQGQYVSWVTFKFVSSQCSLYLLRHHLHIQIHTRTVINTEDIRWRRSDVFIVNFKHISCISLVFHCWLWTSVSRLGG